MVFFFSLFLQTASSGHLDLLKLFFFCCCFSKTFAHPSFISDERGRFGFVFLTCIARGYSYWRKGELNSSSAGTSVVDWFQLSTWRASKLALYLNLDQCECCSSLNRGLYWMEQAQDSSRWIKGLRRSKERTTAAVCIYMDCGLRHKINCNHHHHHSLRKDHVRIMSSWK